MIKLIHAVLLAGLALTSLLFQPALAADADAVASRLDRVLGSGKLRICMTGDYKPFTFYRPDQQFEGIDVELAQSLAKSLGVEAQFVKTTWSTLMNDFVAQCDVAMGGVSITLERQKKAAFSAPHMVDGKSPIVRCADRQKFNSFDAIDQPGTRAIVNPGGTNERFARANYKRATLLLHPDNVTIFQQIVDGRADVMVTDASETLWQAKLHPELCPVTPEHPLQFAEKAFMLPRGDVAFKEYVDAWLHLAKETGEYQRIFDKWLK
ncbi:transporter substrate-binding domain-containing protein [Herbaspirillum sp. YR522]|uniref:transporter substrate-binding domain-containing protein n=1 Tax=Herbaspirillum sp. YR522 TaxID=1144342 RepID=UPI00026FA21E|nr:transporter substrate-binding domain-containing protein [Herbaspirillum sp. YR522]EJN09761.1 periplasmic component of amino acid ABC-type transporter/signal transduction system [Herbaspirillum sp. YR522]